LTIWKPDTCHCTIKYDDDFQNPVFVQQCRTHNNPNQTLAHNKSFNLRNGPNPTPPQQQSIGADKILEKLKPAFQRR